MGQYKEEEAEADSAAEFWPCSAWWAGLEAGRGKLFHGRLSLTDGPILLTFQGGGDHREPHSHVHNKCSQFFRFHFFYGVEYLPYRVFAVVQS